jgi:general secretion pathway protein K
MNMSHKQPLTHQRGVAVITALLLTTLAITIVASLFWQQQVQVRSIENQRLQLQKQWILRGALDWTRLILREDKKITKDIDHLGEPWAVPLAETRLDQYVDKEGASTDVPDAALSGSIVDAQSRFNLRNLCPGGTIDEGEVAAFGRLLSSLQLNPALARATALLMESAQKKAPPGSAPVQRSTDGAPPQPMNIEHVDDLLAVPGFTPEILDKLKDFIVVLPTSTKINVNTASAEVLAAKIATLSLSDAAILVASRQGRWFSNEGDVKSRLPPSVELPPGQVLFGTDYFLVNGNVRLNRAGMEMQALIYRARGEPRVVWIREH